MFKFITVLAKFLKMSALSYSYLRVRLKTVIQIVAKTIDRKNVLFLANL